MDAGGLVVRMTGSASGNRLTISGRERLNSVVDMGYEDWNSTIDGNNMSGTFTLRFYPAQNGVRGGVSWKQNLVGVTRAQ